MKNNLKRNVIFYFSLIGLYVMSLPVLGQFDPLPDGYYNRDIGEPDLPSVTKYWADDDVYELSAGGFDTWNQNDECNFVYFETEEDKEVVVRVHGFLNPASEQGWNAKGFIMVRSSLDDDASMVFLEATGPDVRDQVYLSGRRDVGINAEIFGVQGNVIPLLPRWLKFVRQGRYITGYHKDDTEDAQWQRIATVELALKGKAYMGIGACGGGAGTGYVVARFDKLEVRDIEIPYQVTESVNDVNLKVEKSKEVDVTDVFGHYVGDYWTIAPTSSDERIATVEFTESQVSNPADGEEFRKKIKINGISDGVVSINMFCNIAGYKMSSDFIVVVDGDVDKPTIKHTDPNSPWSFTDLSATNNPEVLSWMEYTGSINNKVTFLTESIEEKGPSDNLAFLYRDFNMDDSIQVVALIDSVKNTGTGSFTGFMLRQNLDNDATAPFVGFSLGAYQGLRFNYRWYEGGEVEYLDEKGIKAPCWIRFDKFKKYGIDYVQVYYSYDNIYWTQYLKYPFNIEFLNNDIVGGFVTSGGNYSPSRGQISVVKNIDVKINQSFDPVQYSKDIIPEKLKISPNPVTDNATITYKITQPGVVTINVYDAYGYLKAEVLSEYQGIGDYSINFNATQLESSGVYLLRLLTGDNYQFVTFIYNKN